MTRTEETQLFLEYRNTGDPEALARVFDRVAPKLLLVAAHLSRDHAIAEDLVQTTFVAELCRNIRGTPPASSVAVLPPAPRHLRRGRSSD